MPEAWVIYNPYAGRFPAGPLLERAGEVLTEAGWTIEIKETKAGEDLTTLARRAVDVGTDTVFVAGGDGSVGLVAAELAGTDTSLAVLPAGTANVWAKELGLPRLGWIHPLALEEAAERLARGHIRQVDLGSCAGRTFMLWAGIGLDGKIVNSIEPRARWEKAFAIAHYATLAVWESLDWTGIDLRVRAAGEVWEDRFLLAVASNIRAYAGGFLELSREAKIDDGLFDFWLLRGSSVGDAVGVAVQILMGRQIHDAREVIHFRAPEAVFESEDPLPMHFDGEPGPQLNQVRFEVRPRVLNVLIPEGGWPPLFSDLEGEPPRGTKGPVNIFSRWTDQFLRGRGCLWMLAGGVLGLVVLVGFLWLSPWLLAPQNAQAPTPVLTVIAFPTITLTPTIRPTPTDPPAPTQTATQPPAAGDLRQGGLVQIQGTEGDGLRLRQAPGLGAEVRFVALENEVFEIQDGPRSNDGYTWWFLVNPYDNSKQGWGVSNYLRSADGG